MNIQDFNDGVDQYADRLYRFALKSCGNSDQARDFVQDSFEKLWTKLETVEADKMKSYLFTTVYNAIVDSARKNQRKQTYEANLQTPIHVETTYFDVKEKLNEGLQKMPEIQRQVVLLRDYEGYSYQEIGEITGLSEQQVKVYIFRARKFLQAFIGQLEVLI
jgi:RNA polymerase sigma-70 factor (ECF subfamily)